jgi:hypothetical protein
MESNLTAVEWLEKEIEGLDTAMSFHYFKDKINQAKEMEKQQIIDARLSAPSELVTYSKTTYLKEAEQYFEETFNK